MDTLSSSSSMVGSGDVVSTEPLKDSEDSSRNVVSTLPDSLIFSEEDLVGCFVCHGKTVTEDVELITTHRLDGVVVPGCLVAQRFFKNFGTPHCSVHYLCVGSILSVGEDSLRIQKNGQVTEGWTYSTILTPEAEHYIEGKVSK